jgi:lycopene cyclase domain-containing protein
MKQDAFLNSRMAQFFVPTLGVSLIFFMWFWFPVQPNQLIYDVENLWALPILETRYLYLSLHIFTFFPIFLMSFDRKVAFYRSWRRLFPALLIVAFAFIGWDIWKTEAQVWGFNDRYYLFRIGNLPIEEWFFFITFPWAAVFIYECLNAYFPKNEFFKRIEYPLSITLIFFFFLVAAFHIEKAYSFSTFMAAGLVLFCHFLFSPNTVLRARFYRAFLVGLIPFILVNGILTGIATQEPIVVYNPAEYLGLRFLTIPFDDFAYNFALLLSVIGLYESKLSLKS